MAMTPEQKRGLINDMVDAGFEEWEIEDTLRGQGEGGPQFVTEQSFGRQALTTLPFMALPMAGGVLGRRAGVMAAERIGPGLISKALPFTGSVFGQYGGGVTAGLATGQSLPEANRTGMVAGVAGGVTELGTGLLGEAMARTGGIPKYATAEIRATEGGPIRRLKTAFPGAVTEAEESAMINRMTDAPAQAKANITGKLPPEWAKTAQGINKSIDDVTEEMWNLFNEPEKPLSRVEVVRRYGRALVGQEEGSETLRRMLDHYERAMGTDGEISRRLRQLAVKRALTQAEQTEMHYLSRTIARVLAYTAGGYGIGNLPAALTGAAVGAYSPEIGKFLLATNRVLGRTAAGGAAATYAGMGHEAPTTPVPPVMSQDEAERKRQAAARAALLARGR